MRFHGKASLLALHGLVRFRVISVINVLGSGGRVDDSFQLLPSLVEHSQIGGIPDIRRCAGRVNYKRSLFFRRPRADRPCGYLDRPNQ